MNESTEGSPAKGGKLKWILLCGCLAAGLACVASSVALFLGVMGAIKSSDAYQGAMTEVRASSAVAEALGSPIAEGSFVQGNINVSPNSGNANLTVPISGPKGEGAVHVQATKSGSKWTYSVLRVQLGSGESIDLLVPEQDDGGG